METKLRHERKQNTSVAPVDFMIIGAQKCGTTSLAAQLASHPDICFCRIKEPGYFHQTEDWRADLEAYHKLYTPLDGQLCGEASTMYTFLPEWRQTHTRLFEYNPSLKLIYIMRQPVERVISHYAHDLVRGFVKAPPEKVVLNQPIYINRSRYGVQIRPYLELFPRDQILLLIFEEFIVDQRRTLRQINDFLGIRHQHSTEAELTAKHKSVGVWYLKNNTVRQLVHTNGFQAVRPYIPASLRHLIRRHFSNRLQEKPRFSSQLKAAIWRFLEDDVRVIEGFLERPLDVWRQGYDR